MIKIDELFKINPDLHPSTQLTLDQYLNYFTTKYPNITLSQEEIVELELQALQQYPNKELSLADWMLVDDEVRVRRLLDRNGKTKVFDRDFQ